MTINFKVLIPSLIILLEIFIVQTSTATTVIERRDSILRDWEDISGNGKYRLKWEVNFTTNTITFDVEVETKGYVGFGISYNGRMAGADIVIGGVGSNGTPYFWDRYGQGNFEPVIDDSQDWQLLSASETTTHTNLKFTRLLDTCDTEQDIVITSDTLKLIWSYGETDQIVYHLLARGIYSANLLDPPIPPVDTSKYDKWTLERNMEMPSSATTYWCTIHKSPVSYTKTRHVVGFNTLLTSSEALAHTHHLNVYICTAPPGQDPTELFDPYVGHPGGECYAPRPVIPAVYCRTALYVWAVGGKPMFFPEHVGFPITEGGQTDYLMFELHYNNPMELEGVQFTSSVEIFNTETLREQNAGVLLIGHSMTFSHLIPPKASNFVNIAHCGPECTGRTINQGGINFVNVMLHSHLLGRKMRLRHFRGNHELPWVSADDNYDFDYQQNRPLNPERIVLPSDQLTMECTTDSSDLDRITIGGLSTTDEMCQAIVWYYPAGELRFCESAYPEYKVMTEFGITNLTWDNIVKPPIVTAPAELAGLYFTEAVKRVRPIWSEQQIQNFQHEVRFTDHYEVSCGRTISIPIPRKEVLIGYPENLEEYVPPETCTSLPEYTDTWVFDNNGVLNYMTSLQIFLVATGDYRRRGNFSFTPEGTGSDVISISTLAESGRLYAGINADSKLVLSPTKQVFRIHPDSVDHRKFNILWSNESLVTRDLGSGVFEFFLQSRYPHEHPAIFFLNALTIEESYRGERGNILPTLKRIRNGDLGGKPEGYDELVSLMRNFGHIPGEEIFYAAIFIKEDLGGDGLFLTLPDQVQLLLSGSPLSLAYAINNGTTLYPMKYEIASDTHQNILPYEFTYSEDYKSWSITYADKHQLYIGEGGNLLEKMSDDKIFTFRLQLQDVLNSFHISDGDSEKMKAVEGRPPYSFARIGWIYGERFVVGEYKSGIQYNI